MFLHELTSEEKKAFLTLAKEFIIVDGALSHEEERLIHVMKAEMGLENGYPEGTKSRAELYSMFKSRASRIQALIEMQGLGYANMEYHVQEKAFIAEMAQAFQISDELLEQIDEWVVRQVALLYEAQDFWSEETVQAE